MIKTTTQKIQSFLRDDKMATLKNRRALLKRFQIIQI